MSERWIAIDWGTSRLRIWVMQGEQVDEHINSADGMLRLQPEDFQPILLGKLAPWLEAKKPLTIVASGMIGARLGWCETPYIETPCAAIPKTIQVDNTDPRLRLYIVRGISQRQPANIMRGEETEIAGLLTLQPDFDGLVILPGTHCKWVHVTAGEVQKFTTFMTGELYGLLSQQSVLSTNLGGWSDEVFCQAVAASFSEPQALTAKLFSIRAAGLLERTSHGMARLSGLLIGAELAAMHNEWNGKSLALIGADHLTNLYRMALQQLGNEPQWFPNTPMSLYGLCSAHRGLEC